jgi:hypothetical protein
LPLKTPAVDDGIELLVVVVGLLLVVVVVEAVVVTDEVVDVEIGVEAELVDVGEDEPPEVAGANPN